MRNSKYAALHVGLILIIIFLSFMIFRTLLRPQKFKTVYDARTADVVLKLKDIRILQGFYKLEKGSYANTFEQLRDFWNNGKMTIVVKEGTVPDTLTEAEALSLKIIRRDTLIVNAKEEMMRSLPNLDIDKFDIVPYSKGECFFIKADTILRANIPVYVYQVIAFKEQYLKDLDNDSRIKNVFLGRFLYNGMQKSFLGPNYDYRDYVKDIILGSLTEPSTDGNWER